MTIPRTVKYIPNGAFVGCTKLANTVTSLGYNTFGGCKSLESVVIGTGIKEIPRSCFTGCTALKTVKINGDNLDDCVVEKMQAVPASAVSVNPTQVGIYVGETANIGYNLSPSNSTDTVKYVSSNSNIATVNQHGTVKGVAKGSVVITVETNEGKVAQATVDAAGNVKAVAPGTATAGSKSARVKITVKKAPSKIKFKKKSVMIKRKKSTTLKYTLTKNTYTYKLTWKSSNRKIATVNSKGKVTGVKKGSCKITVKTHNGKKATIKVKVK